MNITKLSQVINIWCNINYIFSWYFQCVIVQAHVVKRVITFKRTHKPIFFVSFLEWESNLLLSGVFVIFLSCISQPVQINVHDIFNNIIITHHKKIYFPVVYSLYFCHKHRLYYQLFFTITLILQLTEVGALSDFLETGARFELNSLLF